MSARPEYGAGQEGTVIDGKRLRGMRISARIGRVRLGAETGITPAQLDAYESGRRPCSKLERCATIAKALDCDLRDILTDEAAKLLDEVICD